VTRERLTKAQAAERIRVGPKQIERWMRAGMPCKGSGEKRRFPWPEIGAWRDKLLVAQGEAKANSKVQRRPTLSLDNARVRRENADARLKEMAIAQAEGRVISLEVHEARFRTRCDELAARCRTLNQYAGEVQLAVTEAAAVELLDRIGDKLLRALAETAPDIDDDGSTADERATAAA
jgi:hypothetical protein